MSRSRNPIGLVQTGGQTEPHLSPCGFRWRAALAVAVLLMQAVCGNCFDEVVIIRDKDGNEVARIKLPQGGKVEVAKEKEKQKEKSPHDDWLKSVASMQTAKQVEALKAKLLEHHKGAQIQSFDYDVEMAGVVTAISVQSAGISDVSLLRAFTGLRTLHLHRDESLRDLTPLKGMQLTKVIFNDCRVIDLSPLKDMKLTYVDCDRTPVRDLSPLRGMKLTYLSCRGTQVSDLLPLKDMKLTYLNCRETQVSDLSPLNAMPLLDLNLDDTQVTDEGLKLSGLKSLQTLRIGGTKVTDEGLKELSGLSSLRWLTVGDTIVTDKGLKALAGLKSLRTLVVGGSKVTEAGAMEFRKAMPEVKVYFNAR
jgi:Leucine-rich repeat (LRR) protein